MWIDCMQFVLIQIDPALCELSSVWCCPGAEGAGEGWVQCGGPLQAGSAVWLGSGQTRQLSPKDRQGHQNTAAAYLPWYLQNRYLSVCLRIFFASISINKAHAYFISEITSDRISKWKSSPVVAEKLWLSASWGSLVWARRAVTTVLE